MSKLIKRIVKSIEKLISSGMISLIKLYQVLISPLTVPSCRFYPSCSEYTLQHIKSDGPLKGIVKGMKRLSKCHPFHSGGLER